MLSAMNSSALLNWRVINSFGSVWFLLALRGCSRGQAERRRHGNPPSRLRLHKNPLRNAARRRVFLRHGVAVSTVYDAGLNWQNSQVLRDQSIGPGRVATRTPPLIPELEPRWSISSERAGMKICREIPC